MCALTAILWTMAVDSVLVKFSFEFFTILLCSTQTLTNANAEHTLVAKMANASTCQALFAAIAHPVLSSTNTQCAGVAIQIRIQPFAIL